MSGARLCIGFSLSAFVGVVLAVTDAPPWAGIVAVAALCFTVLPWMMLGGRRGR